MKTSIETKYEVHSTSGFRKQLKKVVKQGKDLSKLEQIIIKLANGEELEEHYQNHLLNDSKHYKKLLRVSYYF